MPRITPDEARTLILAEEPNAPSLHAAAGRAAYAYTLERQAEGVGPTESTHELLTLSRAWQALEAERLVASLEEAQ